MDRIEELANRARQWTVDRTGDDPIPEIEAEMEHAEAIELARLHEARAAAVQSSSPQLAADDSLAAAALYAREGMSSHAAALAATAAGMAELAGDWAGAIEHAVAATVQLSDVQLDDAQSARASNALCAFYGHMAAFELAIPFGRRSAEAAARIDHPSLATAAFVFGYTTLEAIHAEVGSDHERAGWRRDVASMAATLRGIDDPVSARVLGGGLAAEAALLEDDLDTAAEMVAGTDEVARVAGPLLQPWFSFVRASVARRQGDLERAEELLTDALPGLEATADDHCLVRALAERALVREERGDLAGALGDTRRRAELVRRWQVDRVEQFALLVAARAELERDGSLLRRQAGELVRAATEDPLTGLYSRRWLSRRVSELETLDSNGSVLLIDIDHFKVVNDTHGHGVGDKVLTAVGDVLRASFRDGDVVRYGGEEFLIPLLTDPFTAGAIAERARMAITHASFDEIVGDLRLTISIGIASGPLSRIRELIDAADDALYVAKQSGRNRVVSADSLT
ncbi:MAG: diguanylate cyclase [Actinomycetota bacterium]